MPRDLEAVAKEDGMPPITKSPDTMEERPRLMDFEDEEAMISALSQRNEKRDELHPYTQTLNLSDIDSCVKLEEAAFPPEERATREKVSRIPINQSITNLSRMTPPCHRDMLVILTSCMRCLLPLRSCVSSSGLLPTSERGT